MLRMKVNTVTSRQIEECECCAGEIPAGEPHQLRREWDRDLSRTDGRTWGAWTAPERLHHHCAPAGA